jgi:hypothetical protein
MRFDVIRVVAHYAQSFTNVTQFFSACRFSKKCGFRFQVESTSPARSQQHMRFDVIRVVGHYAQSLTNVTQSFSACQFSKKRGFRFQLESTSPARSQQHFI